MDDEMEPAPAGDGACVGVGVPATANEPRRWRKWPSAAAAEVVRRTASGEAMRAICRDPEMPAIETVRNWMAKRPAFRAAVEAARGEAGRSFVGCPSSYCQETAEIIFQRLCTGEGLVKMCREDPTLPAPSTVYRWIAEREDFRTALGLARAIAAEFYFEKGWELAEAATPATAYATDVKLKHLRWHAGKLEPRKYGALRPQDPAPPHDEDDRNNLTVVLKNFVYDHPEDESGAEQVLYTMKRLPQTPAARRDAEQARAEARVEARAAAVREAAEARRREAEAGRAAPPAPEKPWDPEGWT